MKPCRRFMGIVTIVLLGLAGACGGDTPENNAGGSTPESAGQPAGPVEEIIQAQASLRATPRDVELDALIDHMDLEASFGDRSQEIIDQWRKTRIEAARSLEHAITRTGRVPGLAAPSPQYTPDPSIMQGLFPYRFATWLDELTAKGGSDQAQQTKGGTEEGPTTRTTTVLDETFQISGNGSRATASLQWVYHTKTVDKATGATLLEADEDRMMSGTIDVCPTTAGLVPASLDSAIEHVAAKNGGAQTKFILKTNSMFSGQVNDQAILGTVDQEIKTSISFPSGIVTGALSVSGGKSSVTFGGDASGTGLAVLELGQASMYMSGADGLDPYDEAQRLWRHGRCVVVQAYGAETPIRVAEQDIAQHLEKTAVGREAKFEVTLRHRFGGGTLNQPVEATLAVGAGELDPARIDAPPGEISYTAVSEGETRARLESTSNRGIGTLVLRFEIKPARWAGTVKYTFTYDESADYGGGYGSSRTETTDVTARFDEGEPGSWSGQYTVYVQETSCGKSRKTEGEGSAAGNAWLSVSDSDAGIYGESLEGRQTEDDATVGVEIGDGAYRISLQGSVKYEEQTTYSFPGDCGQPGTESHSSTSGGRRSISASANGKVDPKNPDTLSGSDIQQVPSGGTVTISWALTRS